MVASIFVSMLLVSIRLDRVPLPFPANPIIVRSGCPQERILGITYACAPSPSVNERWEHGRRVIQVL